MTALRPANARSGIARREWIPRRRLSTGRRSFRWVEAPGDFPPRLRPASRQVTTTISVRAAGWVHARRLHPCVAFALSISCRILAPISPSSASFRPNMCSGASRFQGEARHHAATHHREPLIMRHPAALHSCIPCIPAYPGPRLSRRGLRANAHCHAASLLTHLSSVAAPLSKVTLEALRVRHLAAHQHVA